MSSFLIVKGSSHRVSLFAMQGNGWVMPYRRDFQIKSDRIRWINAGFRNKDQKWRLHSLTSTQQEAELGTALTPPAHRQAGRELASGTISGNA